MQKKLGVVFAVIITCCLITAGALYFKQPSNDLDFQTAYKILPSISLQDNMLSIRNLRDFRYFADGSIKQANYLDSTYSLSQLNQTWLGISHFHSGGLAHALLSFEFKPTPPSTQNSYLVVSIEARMTHEQDKYSPIKGLFRQYNKTVVLATEQDVIGLRSHIRHERVLLYPLKMNAIQQQALLLNFIRMSNQLINYPEFYNSFTDNCLTGLMTQSYYFQHRRHQFDYRIILPGYADQLADELELINLSGSLTEMRQQATVNPAGFTIDDPDFSQLIRHQQLPSQTIVPKQP